MDCSPRHGLVNYFVNCAEGLVWFPDSPPRFFVKTIRGMTRDRRLNALNDILRKDNLKLARWVEQIWFIKLMKVEAVWFQEMLSKDLQKCLSRECTYCHSSIWETFRHRAMPDPWSRRGKAKRSHKVFPSEDLSDLKDLLQDLVFGVTLGWISWKCKQQGSIHVLTNHDLSFFVLFYCATSWPRTCAKATPVPTNWDLSHAKSRMWVPVSMLQISHPDLYIFTWWDTEAKKLYKIWQSSNSFMHTFDI